MTVEKFASTSTCSSCSIRLSTLLKKISTMVTNRENISIILQFCQYMEEKGSSENHQVNNLKVVTDFARYLGPLSFYEVRKRDQIISFLNKKIKTIDQDPDKRWITTWNHYLNRIKLFERWLYNCHLKNSQGFQENEEWITPEFCKIKPKQTKRISPYLESEIWDRQELVTIIKYEPNVRNKCSCFRIQETMENPQTSQTD